MISGIIINKCTIPTICITDSYLFETSKDKISYLLITSDYTSDIDDVV